MSEHKEKVDLTKYSVYNGIRHGIESRYFFPDIDKALEEVKYKLVQIDAYYPEYLSILCVPITVQTNKQKEFISKFNELLREPNCVNTLSTINECPSTAGSTLDLVDAGIIPDNIGYKLSAFFQKLDKLNIEFTIVGLGGGGSNALRIFGLCDNHVYSVDYDKVEVHNLPRLHLRGTYPNKADCVGKTVKKFDIHTNERTLIYSGVDYHDRQTVCDNESIIAVQVGFSDDRCIISANPENVGIFAGDTYGTINTHTMMLNAYRGVDVFLDWFLGLTDEEIENQFTESTSIADFSILDDAEVSERLFLEPVVKKTYLPEFIDYNSEVPPIYNRLYRPWVVNTLKELTDSLKVGTIGFDFVPMYKVSDSDHESLCSTLQSRYRCDYMERNHVFKNYTTELAECTLQEAVLEAEYRFEKMPKEFLGIIISVDDTHRVNMLHPLTAQKVLKSLDRNKTYKFWIYMAKQASIGKQYDEAEVVRIDNLLDIAYSSPQTESENEVTLDVDESTGVLIGACSTYSGKYVLGLDTILSPDGMEHIPYYGYLLGDMASKGKVVSYTDYDTGNASGNMICTGDADNRLFSSRFRQHTANPHSVYSSKFIPTNEFGGIWYAIDTSLNIYFTELGLNEEAADE